MSSSLVRHRFSVEDYEAMISAGILTEDDRVELLEGEILEMSPIGKRHAASVDRFNRVLTRALGDRAIVRVQNPVRVNGDSEPEPDLSILKPRADFYASGHPGPADIFLIIEVADTTQKKDRGIKIPLYARAGVAESWLADLEAGRVVVYRKPSAKGYRESRAVGRKGRISPAAFPDVEIRVADVLA